MLQKMRMVGEIVVFAMFEDKDALWGKQLLLEDEVGNLGQFLQGVWRVSKDEVVLLFAGLQEAEDIGTKGDDIAITSC